LIEGVRTTRWKYVRYTDVRPVCEQLFDVEKDPDEVNDLARADEHASTLADLRRRSDGLRAEASPRRPNIVFFLADDLGYGDLGCHGNPHVKTPQLDAFAREAVALTNFHVSPVCSPTCASLMTGRYHFRTGVCDVFGRGCQMDPAEVTLAEALRSAGYATGIFGKWHLGDDAERCPNAQGFDEALVHTGPAVGKYFDPELVHNGQRKKFTGYCMDIFTEHALEFMRHNRTRPFFLYLPANLIHVPLQVSDELAAPFVALGLGPQTSKAYGMLKSVDDSFGRVRATLKELGLEDNTLLYSLGQRPLLRSVPTNRFMAGLHGLKGTV
jgi:arylsulfatase/arylsulfatase A